MAEKSKVYFADFRAPSWRENLPQKLARLMMTAGFGDIDMDGKYVAIKMHFGEPGNLAYLRPNWARAVVDLVKSHGGKPFLTDCNTLYVGGRKNALDHIESAYINGFTPYSTGCHILIADGLKGNDEVEVPVEGGEYVKSAKIGRAVMDADVFISLMMTAGFGDIDMDGKYVAIKMHFGEPGNLAYLRPNWARAVVDLVKSHGGKPFLTDCNTLYVGGRKNALDHIESAYINGFTPYSTGCHILIADGLKGNDEVEVPVEGGEYVKSAKIGRAVMDADVFISLTHFKGHEQAGMGGALKNIGMGCGSRAGKMEQHNSGKPFVKQKKCIGCRACARICAHGAPQFGADGKATIDTDKCVGCARCLAVCPKDAIQCLYDEAPAILNKKIAEYTKAVVDGRPCFHVSLVVDVSPNCDCHAENDVPIVPDVGMFASFDPVALDQACADAVLAQTPAPNSALFDEGCDCSSGDYFHAAHPDTDWAVCLEHAEKIGIGTRAYELIKI